VIYYRHALNRRVREKERERERKRGEAHVKIISSNYLKQAANNSLSSYIMGHEDNSVKELHLAGLPYV
jgi:hypothetical protein